ncbi:MAG: 16S rRNA (uracil(1498)-N(3))-methyltransferase [Candidatus Saccharimonadales bacterium]
MRLHRFYIAPHTTDLKHNFWLHDQQLIHQWLKVLRFQPNHQVILFDGVDTERLYKILEISATEAHLELITDFVRKVPSKEIYLFWSLLKKDKNDWVLQKCTELGVSHFVPVIAERSEKTSFDEVRARKIIIEASEQCGRSDLPSVREPIDLTTVMSTYQGHVNLFVCEQAENADNHSQQQNVSFPQGVIVGPEGGWSENEVQKFRAHNVSQVSLHNFTLRAETACVAAITKMIQ